MGWPHKKLQVSPLRQTMKMFGFGRDDIVSQGHYWQIHC